MTTMKWRPVQDVQGTLGRTGSCVPAGLYLPDRENTVVMGPEVLTELCGLVAEIDAALPARAYQYPPAGPASGRLYELLLAAAGENGRWTARVGVPGRKWDVRVGISAGQFEWQRCRQGWLQSSEEFWA